MWGDVANGHSVSSSNEGIVDINPLNGAVRVIVASPNCCDGVTVSTDGKIVYAESGGKHPGIRLRYRRVAEHLLGGWPWTRWHRRDRGREAER
jgi:hypothetical protein